MTGDFDPTIEDPGEPERSVERSPSAGEEVSGLAQSPAASGLPKEPEAASSTPPDDPGPIEEMPYPPKLPLDEPLPLRVESVGEPQSAKVDSEQQIRDRFGYAPSENRTKATRDAVAARIAAKSKAEVARAREIWKDQGDKMPKPTQTDPKQGKPVSWDG